MQEKPRQQANLLAWHNLLGQQCLNPDHAVRGHLLPTVSPQGTRTPITMNSLTMKIS